MLVGAGQREVDVVQHVAGRGDVEDRRAGDDPGMVEAEPVGHAGAAVVASWGLTAYQRRSIESATCFFVNHRAPPP